MLDVMTDLETMGMRASAPIIAIGAVAFDIDTLTIGESFSTVVDLESSVRAGAVIEASAVMWWMKKSDAARMAVAGGGKPIREALEAFTEFMAGQADRKVIRLWGNGSDFDNVILAETYARLGMTPPWGYFNNRCYRTLKNRYPDVKLERVGTLHNALDDAISQTEHLLAIERSVRGVSGTLRAAA